jgi:periplasmic divalent cation tolerance protein
MSQVYLVYITASGVEEAKEIGQKLVEERLAACVNVIPKIHSFYWWEEKLCEDAEAVILAKTKERLVNQVIKRVKELHSYTLPAILAWPIAQGLNEFLNWVEEETI